MQFVGRHQIFFVNIEWPSKIRFRAIIFFEKAVKIGAARQNDRARCIESYILLQSQVITCVHGNRCVATTKMSVPYTIPCSYPILHFNLKGHTLNSNRAVKSEMKGNYAWTLTEARKQRKNLEVLQMPPTHFLIFPSFTAIVQGAAFKCHSRN